MFAPLPPETLALKTLVADLHDELEGRVARLRLLIALESDFGGNRGLLLPKGSPARIAYVETRQAFVAGHFLSVILLSQCVLENALAALIGMEPISREAKGGHAIPVKGRRQFRETITICKEAGILSDADEVDLVRLSGLRNALSHFREVNDPSHLDRRAMSARQHPDELCENDARFAITLFIRLLASDKFRFSSNRDDDLPISGDVPHRPLA